MSVAIFDKDFPGYETPRARRQRAQLLVTQISFKHEQPLIWHAANTLFNQFGRTKEAKDICYRYTGTENTARLAGIIHKRKWCTKMDFRMHRILQPAEVDGHWNRLIHVYLSDQAGFKLAFTCNSGRAITFFPHQYSIKPFGNKILTNIPIERGMSMSDIGTSLTGTATHEATHAFLNTKDHKLAREHCPDYYQHWYPDGSHLDVYGEEVCAALAQSPVSNIAFMDAECLTYILLASTLTLMHEDLDFSTGIVVKRDKPLAYIKKWKEKTGFAWKGPQTYLQEMPDGYGYSPNGNDWLKDVDLSD